MHAHMIYLLQEKLKPCNQLMSRETQSQEEKLHTTTRPVTASLLTIAGVQSVSEVVNCMGWLGVANIYIYEI